MKDSDWMPEGAEIEDFRARDARSRHEVLARCTVALRSAQARDKWREPTSAFAYYTLFFGLLVFSVEFNLLDNFMVVIVIAGITIATLLGTFGFKSCGKVAGALEEHIAALIRIEEDDPKLLG